MTSITNRPVSPFQPRTPVAPVERQAPEAPTQAPVEQPEDVARMAAAAARAERERSTFTPASPASALRPSGSARVRVEGNNLVMEAQGQVGNRGATRPGGMPTPAGRVTAGGSFGVNGNVRVEVPVRGATAAMRNGEFPNPAAPETWPVGTRARAEVSGQAGFNASLPAGPGRAGRALGLGTSYDRTQTQRYELERTSPETLRATVTSQGRQQDATSVRGLEGRQDQRLERTRTADFNITQPEGRAAYDQFLRTGQLPSQNGPGVTNVGTTDGLTQNREGRVLGREVATTERRTNLTGDGDGNQTVRQTDRNVAGGTQSVDMRVGPNGEGHADTRINDSVRATTTTRPGQPAEINYDLTFTDPAAARMARTAFSGNDADAANGAPFSVRLNESQARQVIERTMGPGLTGTQAEMDRAFRSLSQGGQTTFATGLYNATMDTRNPTAPRRALEGTPTAPTATPARPQFDEVPSIS